jgi:hypothetical protein
LFRRPSNAAENELRPPGVGAIKSIVTLWIG